MRAISQGSPGLSSLVSPTDFEFVPGPKMGLSTSNTCETDRLAAPH